MVNPGSGTHHAKTLDSGFAAAGLDHVAVRGRSDDARPHLPAQWWRHSRYARLYRRYRSGRLVYRDPCDGLGPGSHRACERGLLDEVHDCGRITESDCRGRRLSHCDWEEIMTLELGHFSAAFVF